MKFEKEYGYLKAKGKYYIMTQKDGKFTFKEYKEAKYKISKAKEIAKILEKALDREAVLMESAMMLEDKDFEVLYKMLKSGRKYKPKTRKHYCVDMKIGRFVLPIVDN